MIETVDPFREWDAAYVLGALSSDDRRAFERHIAGCPACTAAVADLAGIPGILTKIDADTAVALASAVDGEHLPVPAYPTIQKLAESEISRRRRLRRGLIAGMAAAAALVFIVGIFAGNTIHPADNLAGGPTTNAPSGTVVAMSQIQPNVMTAELRMTSKSWGTRFDWSCNYGSAWAPSSVPKAYDLVITDTSGAQFTIATWSAIGAGAKGLTASSGIPIADIRTVEIREAGKTTPLVRGEL